MRLRSAVAVMLVFALGSPGTTQVDVLPCEVTPIHATPHHLVQHVVVPRQELGRSQIFDISRLEDGHPSLFFKRGGNILLETEDGALRQIVNRDTIRPEQLSADQTLLRVTLGETSTTRPVENDTEHKASVSGAIRPVALVPNDHPFTRFPPSQLWPGRSPLPRPGAMPEGQVIGDFDGVPVQPPPPVGGQPPVVGTQIPATPAQLERENGAISTSGAPNAVVAIYFRDGEMVRSCNGVQIGRGLILTNLHCATQSTNHHVVHFGELKLIRDTLLQGTPVSGSVRCRARVVSPPPSSTRLDIAVLKISADQLPAPFSSAILPLDDGSYLAQPGDQDFQAWQIQYWFDAVSARLYQKFAMPPPQCRVKRHSPMQPTTSQYCNATPEERSKGIDPSGISHVCDAESGSSGSPLLDTQGQKIIALHRSAGGLRNCAVPAAAIKQKLAEWGLQPI